MPLHIIASHPGTTICNSRLFMTTHRLLLVDDEHRNVELLRALLSPLGYRLSSATDGRAALALFEAEAPDLVLLDVRMPGLDGIDVLTHIRSHPERPQTPVILVTANTERETRLRGMEAGADECLEKPIDAALLFARVRNLLHLKESRDALAASSAALAVAHGELAARHRDLEALQQVQRELTAFIVHDLKSPLAAVMFALDYVQSELPEGAPALDVLRDGSEAAGRLNAMIEDMIDVSRLEQPELPLELAPVELSELLGDVLASFHQRALLKRISILPPRQDATTVRADRALLRRVLENLIENCLRHTPSSGRVAAWVRRRADLEIVISNDGAPIPVAERERIFHKFARGEREARLAGSAGLGLYFCKQAVEAHGGKIHVSDEPGWATSFHIHLPAALPDRWTMRTRTLLLCVFLAIVALTVGQAAWKLRAFAGVLEGHDGLLRQHDRADSAIQQAAAVAVDMETGVRGWLATGDPRFREPYERAAAQRGAALDELVEAERDDADVRGVAAGVRAELEAWQVQVARPLLSPGVFALSPAERLALNEDGRERMDGIRARLEQLRARLRVLRRGEGELLAGAQAQLRRDTLTGGSVVVSALLALGLLVLTRVERPLSRIVAYASSVSAGDVPAISVDGVAEARALAEALSGMASRLNSDRARERRFTELVTGLSSGGDLAAVASVALGALLREQNAAGGLLWVVLDEQGPLALAASHAVDTTALPPHGDPLAREVRASRREVRLELAEAGGDLVIRSGLLEVWPRSLVVTPLVVGDTVVAVLEAAGELSGDGGALGRMLERAALAVQGALVAQRLALLRDDVAAANEELRSQNEELRAQEEELRAQREELVGQQGELSRKNEELSRASRLKSSFLATMSHELRTPLNAVLGFTDVLLGGSVGPMPPGQRACVEDIQGGGRQLLALINDILDLAKIEAGRIELQLGEVDLAGPLDEARQLLGPMASAKGVALASSVARGEWVVLGDPKRIRQIALNLISNALKFTPRGGSVRVAAQRAGAAVKISVADTGRGIAAADMGLLFQPFSQVESDTAGTGLGLVICKQLVELMGGEIGATSVPGEGSVFSFSLPVPSGHGLAARRPSASSATPPAAAAGASLAPPAAAASPGASGAILIVEDAPRDARVTASILARAGYRTQVVSTAEEALVSMAEGLPDLLMVDLRLPGMHGRELVERARGRERALPIVVLTAGDLSSEEQAALERSADLVAQKGVMTERGFLESVATLLARGRPAAPRVLVVDDSDANRRVVRAMVVPAGYELLEASSAAEGLRVASEGQPRVVLMDVRMPGMDGLEATAALRADPRTRDIPVIALSAQAMPGDSDRALGAGCVAYLTKPVARGELLGALARALGGAPPGDQRAR
jgi:signal transduction histidine kinase/CHASE3 domain sensor protein